MKALEVVLQISYLVKCSVLAAPELALDGVVDADAVLGQKILVALEALYQVLLLEALLPSSRRQGWDDDTLDASLDAVGAGLPFVTADLPLLTELAGGAAGELDN